MNTSETLDSLTNPSDPDEGWQASETGAHYRHAIGGKYGYAEIRTNAAGRFESRYYVGPMQYFRKTFGSLTGAQRWADQMMVKHA